MSRHLRIEPHESIESGLNDRPLAFFTQPHGLGRLGQSSLALDHAQRTPDNAGQQFQHACILHHVVEGTSLHHLNGRSLVPMPGHDDEWKLAALFTQALQQLRSRHIAEFQIEHQQVGSLADQPFERPGAAIEPLDLITFAPERIGHQEEQPFLVIDDQQSRRRIRTAGSHGMVRMPA
jgi:hypothetical protein